MTRASSISLAVCLAGLLWLAPVAAAAEDEESDTVAGIVGLLIVVGIGVGLVYAVIGVRARVRRERREREAHAAVRAVADADRATLGEELRALGLDGSLTGESAAAREAYRHALDGYARGSRDLDAAGSDLERVRAAARTLAHGRWWLAAAQARLARRDPPRYVPACYLDPGHGAATRTVERDVRGARVPVEVCASCAGATSA